jgi:hypothetical protein
MENRARIRVDHQRGMFFDTSKSLRRKSGG